ncbi:MAG: hypothetical protein IKZ99_03640 [Salinivirgaceae bacterium]|nr:hypothetical protein [Salinivirgaceae bacterium]
MNKTLYLLILLIIDVQFWLLRFISISMNNWLIIQLVYLILGFLFYGKMESFSWSSSKLKYWWWWVVGIFISMLPALYVYNQSITQSLITYRAQLLLLQIPVLLKIAPTKEEIIKATMWFAAFLWVIYFLQLNNPYIIGYDEEAIERAWVKGETLMLPGAFFVAIPLFYYLGNIKERFDFKSLVMMFVCFLFLFCMQNRSLLFTASALIGWTMLTIKHKNWWLIVLVMAIIVAVVTYSTIDVWGALFDETAEQVENEEYNRKKAIRYFLFDDNPNIWCYLFGNGFLSSHATSHMQDMMELGVYNSDVGFIGYWNNFGIIPIIVFLLMLIPSAIGRHHSHFFRCWAFQILICGLTISYWGDIIILYFALFYYLYYVDLKECANDIVEKPIIET